MKAKKKVRYWEAPGAPPRNKGRGTYTVRFERDEDGVFIVRIESVQGCHSYGRSIRQARSRIREALGGFVEDSEIARLVDDFSRLLPAPVRKKLAVARELEESARKLEELRGELARALTDDYKLSTRDAAELMGVSHQRVNQLSPEGRR